jgi:hypothetical protein
VIAGNGVRQETGFSSAGSPASVKNYFFKDSLWI